MTMSIGAEAGHTSGDKVLIVRDSVTLAPEAWATIAALPGERDAELDGWEVVLPDAETGQQPTVPAEMGPAFKFANPGDSTQKELSVVFKRPDASQVALYGELLGPTNGEPAEATILSAFAFVVGANGSEGMQRIYVAEPGNAGVVVQEALSQI